MKKIAEKRRRRLDDEHNVDREDLQKSYAALDEMYRVSEKDELKKYIEIGKTPKQYYEEQEARGVLKKQARDLNTQSGSTPEEPRKSSTQSLRETLMSKDEMGREISLVKGKDYEQVKVSQGAGSVPDPRIAGPSIYFDTRLDKAAQQS